MFFTGIGVGMEGRLLAGVGTGVGSLGTVCDWACAEVAAEKAVSSQTSKTARPWDHERDMLPVYPQRARIRAAKGGER